MARLAFWKAKTGSGSRCGFCGKNLVEGAGGMVISGTDVADVFKAAELAAVNMLASKSVCPSCGSVFCLECGNAKGRSLNTGSTHCPKCGTKVL